METDQMNSPLKDSSSACAPDSINIKPAHETWSQGYSEGYSEGKQFHAEEIARLRGILQSIYRIAIGD